MKPTLESIKPCLQGVIPSAVFTCSNEGIPNIAFLSQVQYVDSRHVALTMQFFQKTKSNLLENPMCSIRVNDPHSFESYRLVAKYLRSEDQGTRFDEMAVRLAAIADYSGASEIFKLKAIEIFEVLDIEFIHEESDHPEEVAEAPAILSGKPQFTVSALQQTCERVNAAQTLDEVFDSILQAMDLEFGFRNSMILLPDENSKRLLTIASRGYEQSGVGSEVKIGEGVIGRAAETKTPFVHTSLARELIYARRARDSAREEGSEDQLSQAIPLPGLPQSQSQIAIPLLMRKELLGVLFAESRQIFEFLESDEQLLRTLGSVLAMALHGLQIVHRAGEEPAPISAPPGSVARSEEKMIFSFYEKDDCIFLNGEYLIRNVPARILWKLLNQYKNSGQGEFTNRELRMDGFLQLPEIKDNLETRLILLRKRLEKKCPHVKISPIGRGRFCMKISAELVLELA